METNVAKAKRASTNGNGASRRNDAISLLKADHREVEGWFEQFDKARSSERKRVGTFRADERGHAALHWLHRAGVAVPTAGEDRHRA